MVDVAHIQIGSLLDDVVSLAPEWLNLVYQRPLLGRQIVSIHLHTAILARGSLGGNEGELGRHGGRLRRSQRRAR